MRNILGSHSAITMLETKDPSWDVFRNVLGGVIESYDDAARLVDALLENKNVKKHEFTPHKEDILEKVRGSGERPSYDLVLACFMRLHIKRYGGSHWGVKTPGSEVHANERLTSFPRATFVHMVRDPRECASSLLKVSKRTAMRLNVQTHPFEWAESLRLARGNARRFGRRYVVVKYAELVEEPEHVVKEICGILDLEFEPEMLLGVRHPGRKPEKIDPSRRKSYQAMPPSLNWYYSLVLHRAMRECGFEPYRPRLTPREMIQLAYLLAKSVASRGYAIRRK